MEPNVKRPKKKAKKAAAEVQPAAPAAKLVQPDNYPSWRDDENLVDYEPEEPPTFSPAEEDNYSDGGDYPAHRDRPEDNIDNTDDFPAYPAEGADRVGGKRSQFFSGGERNRKASRSIGVGNPLQEDNNSQSEEDQMDSAEETGSRGTSAAPPMGAATWNEQPMAIPL